MKRREFVGLAAGAATAWSLAARAQQAKAMLRVGVASSSPRSIPPFVIFERRMVELGYRQGENFTFDYVRTKGPGLAEYEAAYRELVERNPDILFASAVESGLKAALAASSTTPIVFVAISYDPVVKGYVASLARPGGRVTGLYTPQIEMTLKRLQFLKEAIPDLSSAIYFFDVTTRDEWKAAEDAAAKFGLRLSGIELHDPPYDYDRALAAAPLDNRMNLLVPGSNLFFADRERLAQFTLRNHLACIFVGREWVDAGGLMSYGPSNNWMYSRAAEIVDRIARGAKPDDLPIEQSSRFEFVINLKTAKALGLDFSPTLLARADELIE